MLLNSIDVHLYASKRKHKITTGSAGQSLYFCSKNVHDLALPNFVGKDMR
ncbi:Uncharacterised protein [Escherichia coli]|nr:Uncharacterised protein [Escherichia coli]